MTKALLIATALSFVSIVSSQAHCGTCDHKDEKKDVCTHKCDKCDKKFEDCTHKCDKCDKKSEDKN